MNPKGVFACNELDLEEVQVYGFDYDYTLACYKRSMDYLLYNLGRDMLIQKYKVTSSRLEVLALKMFSKHYTYFLVKAIYIL